jgi:signal recognition particle GTPase
MKKHSKVNLDETQLVSTKAIIDSMTNFERKNPEIISESRRKRIAEGYGTSMQKVNQLLLLSKLNFFHQHLTLIHFSC